MKCVDASPFLIIDSISRIEFRTADTRYGRNAGVCLIENISELLFYQYKTILLTVFHPLHSPNFILNFRKIHFASFIIGAFGFQLAIFRPA